MDWLTGVAALATFLATIFGLFSSERIQLWAFGAATVLALIVSGIYFYQRRRATHAKIADSPKVPFRDHLLLQNGNQVSGSRKIRVFLCHSSDDKPTVRDLYQKLRAVDWIDPWLDEEKLFPGQDWDIEIEKAVEDADAVIVCLSNNSVTKEGYVQRELRFVLDIALEKPEGAIFIIPLRLDDCQPPRRLRTRQYVDYFPKERQNRAFTRLRDSLEIRARALKIVSTNSTE